MKTVLPLHDRNGIVILFAPLTMRLNEASIDKGPLAYAAVKAIEQDLSDMGYELCGDSDDSLHEAVWDQLGHIEVRHAK